MWRHVCPGGVYLKFPLWHSVPFPSHEKGLGEQQWQAIFFPSSPPQDPVSLFLFLEAAGLRSYLSSPFPAGLPVSFPCRPRSDPLAHKSNHKKAFFLGNLKKTITFSDGTGALFLPQAPLKLFFSFGERCFRRRPSSGGATRPFLNSSSLDFRAASGRWRSPLPGTLSPLTPNARFFLSTSQDKFSLLSRRPPFLFTMVAPLSDLFVDEFFLSFPGKSSPFYSSKE